MDQREDATAARVPAVEHDDRDRVIRQGEPPHLVHRNLLRLEDEHAGRLDSSDPGFERHVWSPPLDLLIERNTDQVPDASRDHLRVVVKVDLRNRCWVFSDDFRQLSERFSLFACANDGAMQIRRPLPCHCARHPAEVVHRLEIGWWFGEEENRKRAPVDARDFPKLRNGRTPISVLPCFKALDTPGRFDFLRRVLNRVPDALPRPAEKRWVDVSLGGVAISVTSEGTYIAKCRASTGGTLDGGRSASAELSSPT